MTATFTKVLTALTALTALAVASCGASADRPFDDSARNADTVTLPPVALPFDTLPPDTLPPDTLQPDSPLSSPALSRPTPLPRRPSRPSGRSNGGP